jgi:hypothetical protein
MESLLSSDAWKQQWAAFWSAPWVIGPLILIVGGAVWWFRGKMFETQIAGLKEQIAAMEQRLKLATDGLGRAKDDLLSLDKQFQAYKAEVMTEGSRASSAKVEATILQLRREGAIMAEELRVMQRELEVGRRDPDRVVR